MACRRLCTSRGSFTSTALLTIAALLALNGCSGLWLRPGSPSNAGASEPTWGYSGDLPPSRWAESYPECAGARQSPIRIDEGEPANLPELEFTLVTVDGIAIDTLHTVRVLTEGGTLQAGEDVLTLRAIVFRVPAEHSFSDNVFEWSPAAEMQLVHFDADTQRTNVAIPLIEGEENPFIADVLEQLNGEREEVELEDILPDDLAYYAYSGSMTVPPCSEGVQWYVLQTPVSASSEQLDTLRRRAGVNARPVQPSNGRRILQSD